MQILRHAESAVTMEIYAVVSSKETRAALKRLSDSLEADHETLARGHGGRWRRVPRV